MPRAEPDHVVVWRVGDVLLAVALDDVMEVAAVGDGRTASARGGALTLTAIRGLDTRAEPAHRAIVVRTSRGPRAVAATEVEGVFESPDIGVHATPRWLEGVETGPVKALVRVDDQRTAALLDVEAIPAP